MLQVFRTKRHGESIEVYVGPEGVQFNFWYQLIRTPHEKTWLVTQYPDALEHSAETSLKGYRGYHNGFISEGAHGMFAARSDTTEFVDFHITIGDFVLCTVLRTTEVSKIIFILQKYWGIERDARSVQSRLAAALQDIAIASADPVDGEPHPTKKLLADMERIGTMEIARRLLQAGPSHYCLSREGGIELQVFNDELGVQVKCVGEMCPQSVQLFNAVLWEHGLLDPKNKTIA